MYHRVDTDFSYIQKQLMWIVCLHLEIFFLSQVPRYGFFLNYFQKKIELSMYVHFLNVVLNDRLVVEPVYETMEYWHV
jgi:hypothetical protein